MLKKMLEVVEKIRKDKPESYVKYTKSGYPYLEVEKFLASDKGKELNERMEMVSHSLKEESKQRSPKGRE